MSKNANKQHRAARLMGCLLALSVLPCSQVFAAGQAATQKQIQEVREQIQSLNQSIQTDQNKKAGEQKAIGAIDREIASTSSRIRKLQSEIKASNQQLKTLEARQEKTRTEISEQRKAIIELVDQSFRNGPQQPLKLVLNQQDPASITRLMEYQRYSHEARQEKLERFRSSLDELHQIHDSTEAEVSRLADLKRQVDRQQAQLVDKKKSRTQAVASLNKKLTEQGGQLKTLKANQANLESVLKRIEAAIARERERAAAANRNQDLGPSTVLKRRGNLPWPVDGRILKRFGSQREGDLRYEGVVLNAGEGSAVRSVHNGRVVFADWLRGYGMLTIVDHGNGFLSLYGNNQSLVHQPGDMISAGEVLAYSGSSGQNLEGVYFELRKTGRPVNPEEWCSRR
ncbi:Peptidase, M23B family [gamma proteobacterium HdN1]|nr:Peptidase, M23B family [gamma proteobacterium HdN1]